MSVPTVNDPPYNASGDGVADDTSAIQQALDDGFAKLQPGNRYRITSTLRVPYNASLTGAGRSSSVIIADNIEGAAVATTQFDNEQTLSNFQISGTATRGLEVIDSNAVTISGIRVGRNSTQNLPKSTFQEGFYFQSMFSSTVDKLAVLGATITENCYHIAGAFNGNSVSNLQTSTFCPVNILIDVVGGGPNQGNHFDGLVLQGGDRGLYISNLQGSTISGVYSENVRTPIVLGNDDRVLKSIAVNMTGLFLIGPAADHPTFDERTAHIVINTVTACRLDNVLLVSYDQAKSPTLDGIYFYNPTNCVISCLHGPSVLFLPKERLFKRFVDARPDAGFMLHSTDDAARQTQVMKSSALFNNFETVSFDENGVDTATFQFDYAVAPPKGKTPLTQHADATSYAVDDYVYVGAAAVDGNVYRCVTDGVSGTGTPPTGTGTGISDGSVVWDFHGVLV